MALHGKTHERRKAALGTLTRFGADNDSIRGRVFPQPMPGSALHVGQMDRSPEDVARFKASRITYIVYSYRTPIAWVTETGEIQVPNVRYSVTTTNHQTACRVYLASDLDRSSSASRQHYIDTGRYLTHDEVAEL